MKSVLVFGIGILSVTALCAQEVPRFTFNLGAGFTSPVGGTSDRLKTGWNMQGGAGVNFNSRLGAMLQFNYNGNGLNDRTLANFGVPDGDVSLWSLTVNPIVHLNPSGPVDFYVIGGGGLYSRTTRFTQPGIDVVTAFDPWFGVFYPVAVPVSEILAEYTLMKPGVNIGAGLSFGMRGRAKFYAEARWHRMLMRDTHTDIIPVNFGIRF
jgi:opacity protein-like surface antigen